MVNVLHNFVFFSIPRWYHKALYIGFWFTSPLLHQWEIYGNLGSCPKTQCPTGMEPDLNCQPSALGHPALPPEILTSVWVYFSPYYTFISECSFSNFSVINLRIVSPLQYFFFHASIWHIWKPDQANNALAALWAVVGGFLQRAAFARFAAEHKQLLRVLLLQQEVTTFSLLSHTFICGLVPKKLQPLIDKSRGTYLYTYCSYLRDFRLFSCDIDHHCWYGKHVSLLHKVS